MRRLLVELERVRALEAEHVAGELDDRHLQAEADPEERDLVLARVADREDLALGAAHAEAARDQDRVDLLELGEVALLELLVESMNTCLTCASFAMPPWTSASLRLL